MDKVNEEKRTTLTEQVLQDIAGKITSGVWLPGYRLPNERDLASDYDVARGRIREALRALSIVGLVTIRPGDGTYVKEQNDAIPDNTILWLFHEELHNFKDIYAARRLIETDVYLSCYQNRNEQMLGRLKMFEEKLFEISPADASIEAFENLIDELDEFVGQACGNCVYTKLMQVMIFLRRTTSAKVLEIPESKESAVYHRHRVLHAFFQDDENVVKRELKAFFDSTKGIIAREAQNQE